MKLLHYIKLFFASVLFVSLTGCKKFIEVNPPSNLIVSEMVFRNDSTAKAAISGIYSEMMNNANQFTAGMQTIYTGLYADELYYYSPSTITDEYFKNEITQATHSSVLSFLFWDPAYKYIYVSNLCIEKLNGSTSVSPAIKKQLIGEAKFIRAFCYFNLVSLFGDVPLITGTDYKENSVMPRSGAGDVYRQMIADLQDSYSSLSSQYPVIDRVRANKWVAAALLARIYLYQKDWVHAEAFANEVINSGLYKLESNPANVFLKNSREAIWQLQPVNPNNNTWEGNVILAASANATPTYLVTNTLLSSFDSGDLRKTSWINSRLFSGQTIYYPYKYKVYGNGAPLTEYYMVLRLAEQYLIRAEAKLNQDKLNEAIDDINTIRTRAGLPTLNYTLNRDQVISAIEKERRIELMFEWGHRWFDLKRTGRVDAVLHALKPATWQATDQLWPIPINQINANPALVQNTGY